MVWLVRVVGYHQARHEAGLIIARHAEVVLSITEGGGELRAHLFHNLGALFSGKGGYDRAFEYFRKALAIREKLLRPNHPLVAELLNNLGAVLMYKGELEKSLEYHRKALNIFEKTLGPDHPNVAASLNNIGELLQEQGEHDKAMASFRRSASILETALGSEHPNLANALFDIGNLLIEQGRNRQALKPLERSVSICKNNTCQPGTHGQCLFALAHALVLTGGDGQRAIKLAKQAKKVMEKEPTRFRISIKEVDDWLHNQDENGTRTKNSHRLRGDDQLDSKPRGT